MRFFEHSLYLRAVFADDIAVIAAGFIHILVLKIHLVGKNRTVEGSEGAERVRGEQRSGYPFGKTADELNEQERIMACIDIYQALTEDRPYKKGLSHEKTCDILDDMAKNNFIDSAIALKIRDCFK